MSKIKVKISCFNCKNLGKTCAAIRTPDEDCFIPKKPKDNQDNGARK
uniref:Uncharacterized protein n=1 Tax=viral metagenome TaxID=1070528 RepID=A0A6H1ZYD5_9ZZZZ